MSNVYFQKVRNFFAPKNFVILVQKFAPSENKMILFLIIISFFLPSVALGATTGLSQAKFEINGAPLSVSTQELWVTNTDTIAQRYELKADDASFADNVSFIPRKFNLDPEEFQKVVIRFRAPLEKKQAYLSLLSFDANQNSRFKVGNGIKIPVKFEAFQIAGASAVQQSEKGGIINWLHILIWIFDAILLIGFTVFIRARRMRFVRAQSKDYKINFV